MTSTQEAVENVRSLARVFQSVIDLADALGQHASVEGAIGAANAKLVKVKQEITAAEATLAELKDGAKHTVVSTEARIQAARLEAEVTLSNSQDEAHKLLEATRRECDRARQEVDRHYAMVLEQAREHEERRDKAAQELADIEAKINRAKSKMAEILGA